ISVREAAPDSDFRSGSGAKDVRLFRNGSLVYYRPGDAAGVGGFDVSVALVAGPNVLNGSAFYNDDVKSVDATISLIGADSLHRKGRTRIVAVGVGRYANP